MTDTIRAFLALPSPPPLREALMAMQARLLERAPGGRGGPRAVRPELLHLTVKFLGDVAPGPVEHLRAELASAAAATPELDARSTGVTAFPAPARARVVVAMLADEGGRLAELERRLSRAAASVGVAEERRPFRPHVTLLRIKNPSHVTPWLDVPVAEHEPVRFAELVLFQSVLQPTGPIYTALERALLAG